MLVHCNPWNMLYPAIPIVAHKSAFVHTVQPNRVLYAEPPVGIDCYARSTPPTDQKPFAMLTWFARWDRDRIVRGWAGMEHTGTEDSHTNAVYCHSDADRSCGSVCVVVR